MLKISGLVLATILVISCKKDTVSNANEVAFLIALKGSNEIPATASPAVGTFDATYNKTNKILSFKITYSGMTPTAWHIHKGATNATGAVVFNLGTTYTSGFSGQTIALAADQEADLLAGNYYVNIHSALYANGEIRGQLVP